MALAIVRKDPQCSIFYLLKADYIPSANFSFAIAATAAAAAVVAAPPPPPLVLLLFSLSLLLLSRLCLLPGPQR